MIDRVTTTFIDKDGTLWVGTESGVDKIIEQNRFKVFKNIADDPNSIPQGIVRTIFEDSEGILWIGTKGSLNRFDRSSESFVRYSESDGLPNDVIMGILEDSQKNLWISTNRGLSKFNKISGEIRNYDVRDGLQSNEFLVGSYLKAYDGEMFFGGINGFNAFYPEKMKVNPHIPNIVITGFRIFNDEIQLDSAISEKRVIHLTWRDYSFSFDFVALDYIFPEKNQYAYMMEGFENKWNVVGTRRFASYTNLPPGTYTFKVKGSNNDEVWNEKGVDLKVIIHPAFWQTQWFKVLVVGLIAFAVYWVYRQKVKRIKAQKEELERLVKIRTAEVVQQKEELEKQRDHIAEQKQEITDSIIYAKRIQRATLPTAVEIEGHVNDHFIFLKPKDIVSGDFYWVTNQDGYFIIVAADCTGHGVPGAFMSMLGVSFLSKIVNEKPKNAYSALFINGAKLEQ